MTSVPMHWAGGCCFFLVLALQALLSVSKSQEGGDAGLHKARGVMHCGPECVGGRQPCRLQALHRLRTHWQPRGHGACRLPSARLCRRHVKQLAVGSLSSLLGLCMGQTAWDHLAIIRPCRCFGTV